MLYRRILITETFANWWVLGISATVILVLVVAFIGSLVLSNRRLKQERDFSTSILDTAGALIVVLDNNHRVVRFNRACEIMTGTAGSDVVGFDFKKLHLLPEELVNDKERAQDDQEGSQPMNHLEHPWIAKDGTKHVIDWSSTHLHDAQGKLKWIICTGLDVTERKRLQERLSSAQRLETAGRVAGQIAHDFNNLLSPLTAYPELMREKLPSGHALLPVIDEMMVSANRIAEINHQLLALGRRGFYIAEIIDLNNLVEEVTVSLSLPKNIIIHKELAANPFLISGGRAQLMRALTNLISNAKEAIADAGELTFRTVNVVLDKPLKGYQTIEPGKYVKLDISDTGMGIEPEILNKIFDPFFTTKTMDRQRGTGLGLCVVLGIIQDHKGYLTVDSALGKGTTFSLYFPVAEKEENPELESITTEQGGHESILVVDDDSVQRTVARELLQRLGYNVHTVESGEAAVAYVKENAQDLVLLDMVLDGIDGTETYRQILQMYPKQKAIILSGYAMTGRVQEALNLGADSFVSKPIKPNTLASAIRQVMDKK